MSETAEMNEQIRATLEDFGVVKPPKLPKLDVLVTEIRKRGGTVAIDFTDKGASASVGLSGNKFDAHADTPGKAVAEAFSSALLAEPSQTSLFGGDGTLTDEQRSRLGEIKKQKSVDADDESE